MTSNPPAASHGDRVPGTCKRPGCGNVTPVQDRGRTRVFCSDDCARRYHNDARLPAAAAQLPADSSADPLTALDTLIRQAAALTRTAREQAAGLDPARVRAQIADAEATRRRAEAAAVTAGARAAEAAAETQALAEALDAAREDTRAARADAEAARAQARASAAAAEQAAADAADRISAAQASAAAQVTAARTETDRSSSPRRSRGRPRPPGRSRRPRRDSQCPSPHYQCELESSGVVPGQALARTLKGGWGRCQQAATRRRQANRSAPDVRFL